MATALSKATDRPPGAASDDRLARLIGEIAEKRSKTAFTALFTHFAPRIKSFMMRGGADAQLAEDLAQDTMLALWNKASLYSRDRGSAGAWVFTIARNLRIDRLRRQGSCRFADVDDYEEVCDDPVGDEVLMADQERTLVRRAIADLPDGQMDIIRMAYLQDLSQSEIAGRLSIPLGTVKSRMRLAYARLRRKLETTV